jgi:O-succinylbenzoic acid--CoA ligase
MDRTGAHSLPDWLTFRATMNPDHTAIITEREAMSYAELDAAATAMARSLAARGVGAGDRIAMLLHNCIGAAVLVHATLRLGAVLVPLNVRLGAQELEWQLRDSGATVVVSHERTAALAEILHGHLSDIAFTSLDTSTVPVSSIERLDAQSTDVALHRDHAATDPLALIYTSGTTGRPKGAMLTVGNFWWSAIGSALNLGTHTDDRWLACMPLFHVGGLSILLRAAIYGITVVLHDGFDAEAVDAALDRDRITIISVVLVMLQRMLDVRGERAFPASLRCVLLGGGPAPLSVLERCARLAVPVSQSYGLTETTSQVATLPPQEAIARLGSAGRPLYPNEIRIATDDRDAEPGEAGEILVRGPVVMTGYYNHPDVTSRTIVDGWLHTGDLGLLDSDGYLHVLDRRSDLIITGGENVYPAEVESVLLAHPSVAEAAVIGAADDTWGQNVVAIVRLNDRDASLDMANELRAHVRSRLAGYKTPRIVHIVDAPLPRTASGKLKRSALRDQFAANARGSVK